MLKIHDVCKSYNGIKVLDHVSFEITKSDVLGLAGPSGSGKSTLLRCIQKLETFDSGSVECDGKTGFMFQDFQLFPHLTVLQNLVYGPNLGKKSAHRRQSNEKRAQAMLKNLGIEEKAATYPGSLSGGQKQRAALARSLMVDPDILLCDEPTSGLDVATTMDVVQLLQSVCQTGTTMMIASHDLDFLTKISDRIILLRDGKIAADIDAKRCRNPVDRLKKYYAD
ncbi:MAG: ATP-binding cassette domain-containing protein [Holosporaceae bacterium]|jgi:polar amino acid transport system ATP-binding protein|nr:ATP-binding cassette domain-containing protein [Holosporaceae bacterium]